MRKTEYSKLKEMVGDDSILKPALEYDAIPHKSLISARDYSPLKLDSYIKALKPPAGIKQSQLKGGTSFYQEFIKKIPQMYKQHIANYTNIINHHKKISTVCTRELKRGLSRTSRTNPNLKNKRINKELQKYINKQQREEKDKLRKEDAEKEIQKKNDIALKEELRQKRKFNYLMSQTEAFANFFLNKQNKNGMEGEDGIKAAKNHLAHLKEFDKPSAKPSVEKVPDITEDESDKLKSNEAGVAYIHQHVEQPKILKAKLKEYQLKGLNWLVNLYNQGINGILADDMGLGKTVQAISLLSYLAEKEDIWGPFLIITPASTIYNWENEFKKFLPDFRAIVYYGNSQERSDLRKKIKHSNAIITSYQVAVMDENVFKKYKWQYMILDEAQAIKSINSQRWKILLGFKARNRCLLTGTPIQNNMQELWSLLHFIMPTLFDSLSEFSEWFLTEQGIDESQVNKLHTILKPFMLRRHKDDIKDEIGTKEIVNVYCGFSSRQRMLYDEVVSVGCKYNKTAKEDKMKGDYENVIMHLKKVCNHPDLFEKLEPCSSFCFSIQGAGSHVGFRSYFRKYISSKIQFAVGNNSEYYSTESIFNDTQNDMMNHSPKIDRSVGYFIPGTNRMSDITKIPMFSTMFRSKRIKVERYKRIDDNVERECFLYEICTEMARKRRLIENQAKRFIFMTPKVSSRIITTNLKAEKDNMMLLGRDEYNKPSLKYYDRMTFVPPINTFISDSGKLVEIDRLLKELHAKNRRPLIYFQMTRMMDLFEEYLIKMRYTYLRLDGSSKVSLRKELVSEWQTKDIFIFMLSTRAGGVGLNLTAADTVIFYDSDWNPTVDQQAMDRAHRLGQTKNVTVYRLITRGSIEEKVMERANKKDEMQKIVIKGKVFEGN